MFVCLERAWNINIPGFSSSDSTRQQKKALPAEAHKQVIGIESVQNCYHHLSIFVASCSDQEVKEIVNKNSLAHTHTSQTLLLCMSKLHIINLLLIHVQQCMGHVWWWVRKLLLIFCLGSF